jgi:hypothetical protein
MLYCSAASTISAVNTFILVVMSLFPPEPQRKCLTAIALVLDTLKPCSTFFPTDRVIKYTSCYQRFCGPSPFGAITRFMQFGNWFVNLGSDMLMNPSPALPIPPGCALYIGYDRKETMYGYGFEQTNTQYSASAIFPIITSFGSDVTTWISCEFTLQPNIWGTSIYTAIPP